MNAPFRLAAVFAWTVLACLPAYSAAEKNSPAAQPMSWESPLLGKSISCTVRLPDSDAEKNPVVVYMRNLPAPRLGELDDETLIKGFLDQGMVVIEADLLDFADNYFFDKKTNRRFDNWNYPDAELPFDWKAPKADYGEIEMIIML
jgi:hypothetical protein